MNIMNDIPSVLLSIHPYYCHKILIREKLIEVRKNRPNIATPFKCYIYCTKGKLALFRDDKDESERYKFEHWPRADFHEKCGKTLLNGKVIAEFVCDKIYQYTTCDVKNDVDISDEDMTRLSCLTKDEIRNYELSPGRFGVFGWHISDLVIYDEPKELSDFITIGALNYNDWHYGLYNGLTTYEDYLAHFRLKRPPQSWFYVKEAV